MSEDSSNLKIISKGIKNFAKYTQHYVNREIAFYQTKPREALFFLTYRCSCRCKICEMWKREKLETEMDLEGWKKVVDQVEEAGVKLIYLFGGDVLLRKDMLFDLIEYIAQKGIWADVVTNANLMDKDTAEKLMNSGVSTVGVSIDAIGEIHDKSRGSKGIFKRAVQAIKDMKEARGDRKMPNLNIYCNVSKINIDHFHEVFPLALELGVDQLHFEPYGEFEREQSKRSLIGNISADPYFVRQDKSLLLSKEQAIYLKKKINEIEEYLACHDDHNLMLDADNIECLSPEDMESGQFQHKRCYICRYHINIDPNGNVLPCLFFPDYHLGNTNEKTLKEIWGNKKHKQFNKSVDNDGLPICKTCVVGVQRNPTFLQAMKRRVDEDLTKFKRKYIQKLGSK